MTRPDLHALKHIEEVIHARQVLNILKNGYQQGRRDGDGAGEQHSCKTGPPQVQETLRKHESKKHEHAHLSLLFLFVVFFCFFTHLHVYKEYSYLHNKLPRVSACHGGTLSSCQDPYCPDVECSRAKETAQDHSLSKQTHREINYLYTQDTTEMSLSLRKSQ